MFHSRCLVSAFVFVALLGAGCGPKEPAAHRKSVREIDAEIKKVQADANMPAQVKSMALGALKREHEIATKSASARK